MAGESFFSPLFSFSLISLEMIRSPGSPLRLCLTLRFCFSEFGLKCHRHRAYVWHYCVRHPDVFLFFFLALVLCFQTAYLEWISSLKETMHEDGLDSLRRQPVHPWWACKKDKMRKCCGRERER
ncbi:hypothetical protein KSP39_PZI019383 [Platanthera zijinensis]|uniref:Uncharacterized protein n=1 Tax=Platanthera zijinensis TaxID=2320716 RepID=A0AAP0B227_9ASPA